MKRLYGFLIVIALVCSTFIAKAQNDGVAFTLMPHIPYNNYLNPGIRVPYTGMFGIGFSNFNLSIYNSSIKYNNIYKTNSNGEEVIDGVKFINSLDEKDNYYNFNMSMDLLNIGFRVNKLFFNIDYRLRVNTEFQFSKDFLGLFVLGNAHYLGRDNACDFNIGVNATAFTEFGIGVQYDVNEHLTVGIRPKFLTGIANVNITNKDTKIYTDPNSYAISADVDLDIQAASILESDASHIKDLTNITDNNNGSKIDMKENRGLGVDFGASYKFNEKWGVSAGVYDLGYIRWTDAKQKKVTKTDVTINDALFDDYKDLKTMKLDYKSMLDNVIDAVWGNDTLIGGNSYKTTLRTRLMLQGYYEINPMVRFTAIGQLYSTMSGMKPSFTMAYSGTFINHFDLSLSYSLSKYMGNALGFGFGFHAGPFNIFAVSENVLGLTKMSKPTVEFATAYKTTGFRAGIVWTFGDYQGPKYVKKVKEQKEEMPMEVETNKVDTEKIDKAKEQYDQEKQNEK